MPQIAGKDIGPIGFGLMGFTWRETPIPYPQAFETLKAALAQGMNFWNGGEFYGTPDNNSMTLLAAYFEKYPEDADKVVLSMKGASPINGHDGSAKGIKASMDNILAQLQGRKKVDVFECARRDPNVPQEETFKALQEYIDAGLLGAISLSEVRADTIREAVKLTKIAFVEVELSLFNTDILTNGVVAACAEHDIPVVAYSPIGHGMLSGRFKTPADIPPLLAHWPRFTPENFQHNLTLVNFVSDLASRKGCTPAQLAISWTRVLSRRPGIPLIIPIPGSTTVARVQENSVSVEITDAELAEIDEILAKFEVKGQRYPDGIPIDT
ncbi:NADP-dependent oxidoreductase domain-containing protein [Podospora australis]|uniref:NADP-dependent oxidoreductase domain-containing protein n=1 Tax=Podospora australis TaxID=1536484 RepID=A0AAN6X4J1_9PEZI|nr:NADP-dependent oxidoreductase domain-containing protein [Podospora australis]